MKHEVKVGDRFKLGPWEWTVQEIYSASINAYHHKGGDFYHKLTLWLTDADQLDWIKPEVTFTKKQTEELKSHYIKWHRIAFDYDTGRVVPEKSWFIDWLDEHTEKE